MLKQKYQFKNYNWVLIGAVLILSGMGVLFINSADSSYTSKQLVGLIFCTGVMLFLSVVNFNFVCGFNRVLYMINIVLLVLVKLVGVSVNGAQRWINLGFTRLQPSELTKIIMIIFVAVYIQEHEEDFMEWKVLLKLALLCALPLFLVVIEPNLSTTLDITFILLSVIFVGGFSMSLIKKWLKIIIPVMIPLGFLLIWYIKTPNQILLHDYQVTRIMTFLEPSKYSSTSAYQQDNSVMAIGSGKLYGKGLNNNTIADVTVADTGFVSEQQTDFIFSVVGEETGFVGSVIVIALLAIIVIECLKEQGVDTVFGYPGGAILNIYDELYRHQDEIRHVLTSHEQGASHAADGYARATGKVGVCMATSGPGATNLVTGIATAYMDSVPLVAITCNVGKALLGKDSFQEIDIAGVAMPITKYSFLVKEVDKLADTIRRAFTIAKSGRPGPVLIDIAKNATSDKAEYEPKVPEKIERSTENIDDAVIDEAIKVLRNAKKPMVFVGGGAVISGADKELKEFVEKVDAPVTDTLMGKGAFPGTDDRYVGMLGMHGTKTANLSVSECDALVVVGSRFSDRVTGNTANYA